MIKISATDVKTLISLKRLLMLYTKTRKIETKLIRLLTERIKQIKTDALNCPLETFASILYPNMFILKNLR